MPQFNKLRRAGEIYNSRNLVLFAKAGLSLGVIWYGYRVFREQGSQFGDVAESFVTVFTPGRLPLLLFLTVLIPVNWALESWKWQRLASKVVPLAFPEAVRSTLMGVLAGLTLPAQFGEAAGRVLSLDAARRSRTVGAAVVSGGIQFYTSLFAGWAGLGYLDANGMLPQAWPEVLYGVLAFLSVIGTGAFVYRKAVLRWPGKSPWIQQLKSCLEVIGLYSGSELLVAFLIGASRYAVYLVQYVGVLVLFGFSLPWDAMAAGVATVLLVKTVVPAFNMFGDLGMRGLTGLYVFGNMGVAPGKVVAATLFVWAINIFVPVCVGMVVLWKSDWKANADRE